MIEQRQGGTWLDRVIGYFAPQVGLRRLRARVAAEFLARHYEGASSGRRTQGWKRSTGDANAVAGPALSNLRAAARDMVRNNPNAKGALRTIANHVVGWGITAKPTPRNDQAAAAWKGWTDTTACDADGRSNFYGLQKLVMRTVVESGEVLVRRRLRLPEDGLPLPIQLQVLDPDYLDISKHLPRLPNGGRIVYGVEFDAIGRRTAYWLFREHPGSDVAGSAASVRVPAESVLHIYYQDRPGQVRGPSWFAPVLLRFKDFDDYEDATLLKQKVAATLAVITSDVDGSAPGLGTIDPTSPQIDSLEPGAIINVPPGRSIEVVQPPTVREHAEYCEVTLRAVATGLGVTYEDLTGDYTDMPFSAARMSRIAHWDQVEDWRWQMLIPQFCDPVWSWVMQAAAVMGVGTVPAAEWTAPPPPMVDPANEGLAYQRNIRTGIMTLSEAIRERGYDPEEVLNEMAADNARLDSLGIILDSDARMTTQAGNPRQSTSAPAAESEPAEPEPMNPPASMPKKPNGGATA